MGSIRALAKAGELLPLSVNGPALAHNTSALDFLIARELNGTFLLPEIHDRRQHPEGHLATQASHLPE